MILSEKVLKLLKELYEHNERCVSIEKKEYGYEVHYISGTYGVDCVATIYEPEDARCF